MSNPDPVQVRRTILVELPAVLPSRRLLQHLDCAVMFLDPRLCWYVCMPLAVLPWTVRGFAASEEPEKDATMTTTQPACVKSVVHHVSLGHAHDVAQGSHPLVAINSACALTCAHSSPSPHGAGTQCTLQAPTVQQALSGTDWWHLPSVACLQHGLGVSQRQSTALWALPHRA
jgi:hypothetical protein